MTCVLQKAAPELYTVAPKSVNYTFPPTDGRKFLIRSFLKVVVVIPCRLADPPSTTPRFVVPKLTIPIDF